MLVFNEGLPRSGKSYDTVLNHIVPALKKGRKVFARLNGMDDDACRDAIAAWIGKPRSYVDANLLHIDTADVPEVFAATKQASKWTLDDRFRNALVVIDEIHEFWVGGTRVPMPPENEQFFALHGHYGIDIVVMSQHYKRTHTAIRYRVERKNVFQKLSALGSKGEKMFRQTFFQAIAPDKYESVGGETHTYDEKVFALYHGVVPAKTEDGGDEVTQDVYSAGRTTVWKSMALRAAIILPIGVFAIYYLVSFFAGGGKDLVKTTTVTTKTAYQGEPVPDYQGPQRVATTKPAPVDPAKAALQAKQAKLEAMTPEQRYVWDLADKGRIRLAALIGEGGSARGVVEWVGPGSVILERLTLQQLRDLGIEVHVRQFGVRIQANSEAIIATAWPYEAPRRDERPALYDTSGGDSRRVSASEPGASAAAKIGTASIAYSGQMPVGAGTGGDGGAP